jgi:hypothetical protein
MAKLILKPPWTGANAVGVATTATMSVLEVAVAISPDCAKETLERDTRQYTEIKSNCFAGRHIIIVRQFLLMD